MENKEDRPASQEVDMLERMIRDQSDDHRKDPGKAGNRKQDNKPGKSGPRAAVLSLVAVAWVLAGVPGHADTIQVTTTGMAVDVAGATRIPEDETESTGLYVAETLTIDDLPGADGLVSLREAIIAANNTPGGPHTIVLQAGAVYTLTGPDNWWYGPTGLPPITSEIVIEGNGAIIERSDAPDTPRFRLFFINGSFHGGADGKVAVGAGELTLRELTLRNGLARGGNGGRSSLNVIAATGSGGGGLGAGGAVFNQGRLRLEAVTLTGNSAAGGSAFGLGNGSFGGSGGGIGGDGGDGGWPGGGFRGPGFERGLSTSSAFGGNGSTSGGGGGFRDIDNASGGTGVNGGGSGSLNTGGGFGYSTAFPFAEGSGGGVGAGSNGSFNLHAGSGGFGGGGGGTAGWNKSGGDGGFGGGGGGGGEKFNEPDPGVGPGGAGGFGGGVGSSGCCTVGRGGGGGAGMGGAIFNHTGTLVVLNSTLTGNSATGGDSSNAQSGGGFGGAIFNLNGEISIIGSTVAGNGIAPGSSGQGVYGGSSGGAVYSRAQSGTGVQDAPVSSSVTLINSILAGSEFGAFSAGDFDSWASADSSDDASIVQSGWNGSGSPLAIDPQLESPADNGGPAWTMMPQAGSPAIDAGACDPALVVDQRGVPRPQGGDCDIGAVEWIRAGLTVQVSGQGSVDAGPGPEPAAGGIENCDETGAGQPHCAAEYVEGGTENVTLILAPGEHRHIDTANGCGGELDGDTFTIAWLNAGCTVAVVFALDQYTLEYTAGPGGSIDGETPQTVDHGSDGSTVTAVPDAGHHFVQWSDGVNDNPRIDTQITADLSVTAGFAPSVDGIFDDRFQME